MLFNSIEFAIFLPVVFAIYWLIGGSNRRLQNFFLLLASYYFYGVWDYRFLFLLVFSTLLDYFSGLMMVNYSAYKKTWFWLSIFVNLGFLAAFKYYNFFVSSLAESISFFDGHLDFYTLSVILPIGISFYTFHGLSYVIDIYNGRIEPERNFVDYSLFVSFFPLLVAGPIERATHLLPQINSERQFTYEKAADGLKQILWGLFKKIVIADNCAQLVNRVFENPDGQNGSTLVVGAVFFAIQIYCDFSGYSDIALGTARLFGIELLRNFAYPYFSRDIAEFWRRWHISLSSWFRDYLYIPLGGSRVGFGLQLRNTFIIFLVSGFWHGANWTFIVWGGLHALYFLPILLMKKNRKNIEVVANDRMLPSLPDLGRMFVTFTLVTIAWIFFRAATVGDALHYIARMLSSTLFQFPKGVSISLCFFITVLFVTEWIGRRDRFALSQLGNNWPMLVRWGYYYGLVFAIFYFGGSEQEFIYFQF